MRHIRINICVYTGHRAATASERERKIEINKFWYSLIIIHGSMYNTIVSHRREWEREEKKYKYK